MESRKTKIAYLTGLMNGSRQLWELLPVTADHFIRAERGSEHFIRLSDGLMFTQDQIGQLEQANKNPNHHFYTCLGTLEDLSFPSREEDVTL